MMGIPRAFPSVAAVIAMLQSVYITYNYKVVKHDHEYGALIIISNAVFGRAWGGFRLCPVTNINKPID